MFRLRTRMRMGNIAKIETAQAAYKSQSRYADTKKEPTHNPTHSQLAVINRGERRYWRRYCRCCSLLCVISNLSSSPWIVYGKAIYSESFKLGVTVTAPSPSTM